MSVEIMARVWAGDLPLVQKMVLLALADNANDAGVCWPSIATLRRKCSLSERAVQQALQQLQAAGYLTKEEGGGRGHTNRYTVNPAPQTAFEKPRTTNPVSGALNPAPRAPETPHHVHPEPSIEPSRTKIRKLEEYPQEFEQVWAAYPKRPGANKRAAYKAWKARLQDGASADDILRGVKRYASYCDGQRIDSQFVKQPETFLGPNLHFLSEWGGQQTKRKRLPL